jgi:hypothetical protein
MGPWDLAAALMRWSTGLEWAPAWPSLVIAALIAAAVVALWRGDAGQRFLALQAALPWLAALALSAAAGRTLLLERYLFFSQLALIVLLARAWSHLSSFRARAAGASVVGALIALGLAREVGSRPQAPSSAAEAARLLAGVARPGDLLCASSPRDLNVVRYYLARAGGSAAELRTPASRAVGHLSQVASITPEEVVPDEEIWSARWGRVWRVKLHPPRKWRPEPAPPPWKPMFLRIFEGPASTRILIAGDERDAGAGPPVRP